MKKIAVLLLAFAVFATACKDNKTKDKEETTAGAAAITNYSPEAEHDLKVYRIALQRKDAYTAINALTSFLLRDSASNVSKYKDTLAQIYIEMQQAQPAFEITKEIIETRPNDTTILKMNVGIAESIGTLGQTVKACETLSKMYPDELMYQYYYGRAMLENQTLAAQGEKVMMGIIANPQSTVQTVAYPIFEKGELVPKRVKAKVAALMVLGQAYGANNDLDKAEYYFKEVLKIDRFAPAAEAITQINKIRLSR
jgi:tetratricopeptide (TPR) repeat protein